MEWNALTYAGHTVWNVHNERTGDGYKDGEKTTAPLAMGHPARYAPSFDQRCSCRGVFRAVGEPRHRQQTRSSPRVPAFRPASSPDGNRWYGNRTAKAEFCRVKTPAGSRNLPVAKVDSVVVEIVANDLASSDWAIRALKARQQDVCCLARWGNLPRAKLRSPRSRHARAG